MARQAATRPAYHRKHRGRPSTGRAQAREPGRGCARAAAASPLLALTSPEKRCGKTTRLSLLARLVPRALLSSNISLASLFLNVEKYSPTQRPHPRCRLRRAHGRRQERAAPVLDLGGQGGGAHRPLSRHARRSQPRRADAPASTSSACGSTAPAASRTCTGARRAGPPIDSASCAAPIPRCPVSWAIAPPTTGGRCWHRRPGRRGVATAGVAGGAGTLGRRQRAAGQRARAAAGRHPRGLRGARPRAPAHRGPAAGPARARGPALGRVARLLKGLSVPARSGLLRKG
jgi:hypothetical protein